MPTAVRTVTRLQDQDDVSGSFSDGQVPQWSDGDSAFVPVTALAVPLHAATRDNLTEQLLFVHTMDDATFPGGSPAPDYAPMVLLGEYKATNASLDPWDLTYLGFQSRLVYGTDDIAPRGTAHALTATVDVQGSASINNELGGLMGWMRAGATGHEVSCGLVYLDLSVHGAIGGAQLKYQNVASLFSNTYTSNPPNEGPSIGAVCSTYPGKGGGASDRGHNLLTTYPMDVAFLATGKSGVPGAAAGVGWTTAFQAGGYGGWVTSLEGSSIGTGFHARDCSVNGILLDYPLGTTGNALQIGYEPTGWTGHWDWLIKCDQSGAQKVTPQTGAILLPNVAGTQSQIRWGIGGTDPQIYRSDGTSAVLTLRGALIIQRQDSDAGDGVHLRIGRSDAAVGKVVGTIVNDQGEMNWGVAGSPGDLVDNTVAGDTFVRCTSGKNLCFGLGTEGRMRLRSGSAPHLEVGGGVAALSDWDTTAAPSASGTYIGKRPSSSVPSVFLSTGTPAQAWAMENDAGLLRFILPGDVIHLALSSSLLDVKAKPVNLGAMTAPAAPAAGNVLVYSRVSDSHLCAKGSDGVEHDLIVGGGATAAKGTATWDPPALEHGQLATTTVTVTGAALGDPAAASFSADLPDGVVFAQAEVSATNTVTVTLLNLSGSAQNLDSGTLTATIWKVS